MASRTPLRSTPPMNSTARPWSIAYLLAAAPSPASGPTTTARYGNRRPESSLQVSTKVSKPFPPANLPQNITCIVALGSDRNEDHSGSTALGKIFGGTDVKEA